MLKKYNESHVFHADADPSENGDCNASKIKILTKISQAYIIGDKSLRLLRLF